jgi:hypothetical protein
MHKSSWQICANSGPAMASWPRFGSTVATPKVVRLLVLKKYFVKKLNSNEQERAMVLQRY